MLAGSAARYFSRMTLRTLVPSLAIFVALASCGTASPDKPGEVAKPAGSTTEATTGNRITFKVDGTPVNTTGHNIALSKMGGIVLLNITTSMHTDPRTINVNLAGTTAGKYELMEGGAGMDGKSGGLYFPDYNNPGEAYTIIGGTFDLSRVDTTAGILEGTFSATACSGDGKTVSITDGQITDGALARGIVDVEAMMK